MQFSASNIDLNSLSFDPLGLRSRPYRVSDLGTPFKTFWCTDRGWSMVSGQWWLCWWQAFGEAHEEVAHEGQTQVAQCRLDYFSQSNALQLQLLGSV